MNVIRTMMWVILTAVIVAFMVLNWGEPVDVFFWIDGSGKRIGFPWPVGFVALVFFLAGLLPMWLLSRASKWRANRRIATLQNTVAASSVVAPVPVATSTQLEANAPQAESPTI